MKLGTEALFIDLLAETPGAPPYTQRPLAEPEREDAVLAECLTGWDRVFIWRCPLRAAAAGPEPMSRPASRLSGKHTDHITRRLGFPCWLLDDTRARGGAQSPSGFDRLRTWPAFAMVAIKLHPLATALGGMLTVEHAIGAITDTVDCGGSPPVCALTRGSSQIIAFFHHEHVVRALSYANKLARTEFGPDLVEAFRICHGISEEAVPPPWTRWYRRRRYESALHRLLHGCTMPNGLDQLSEDDRAKAEKALSEQPLVVRTNSTLCWQHELTDSLPDQDPVPFMAVVRAVVDGPNEGETAREMREALLGCDGCSQATGGLLSEDAICRVRGASASWFDLGPPYHFPAESHSGIQLAYGPEDIHTGIIGFPRFRDYPEFAARIAEFRYNTGCLFTTVTVPLRQFPIDASREFPGVPRFDDQHVTDWIRSTTDRLAPKGKPARVSPHVLRALQDLGIAARGLLGTWEIAADADDILAALAVLPRTVEDLLGRDGEPAVTQLFEFLTLAIYEREQTLWAEAAPPGAPFHSEGVGMHVLAKAVEWLVGYVCNHALVDVRGQDVGKPPAAPLVEGQSRRDLCAQVSITPEDAKAVHAAGAPALRRWTGCLCLTVLQGVYTSPGGIIHYPDFFAQELCATVPRVFHEIGHLLFELSEYAEKGVKRVNERCRHTLEAWGAADAPVEDLVSELYAHWVEHSLFACETDFCIRSLWQNWMSGPYIEEHPVDALIRTAALELIGRWTKEQRAERALDDGLDAIVVHPEEARRLSWETTAAVIEGAKGPTPFGIRSPRASRRLLSVMQAADVRYGELVARVVHDLAVPALADLMVAHWSIGQNLLGLHDMDRDDYWGGVPGAPTDDSIAVRFGTQTDKLMAGHILTEPMVKVIAQALQIHRQTTDSARVLPSDPERAEVVGNAHVDAALALSLSHIWDINSTYPAFVTSAGRTRRAEEGDMH